MAQDHDPEALVGALADNDLLEPGAGNVPAAVGRPDALPVTRWRGPIVASGVAMTALTLLGGIALFLLGLVRAFSDGADLFDGALVAIGLLLAGTHWGWVHVAELSAKQIAAREGREIVDRRQQWLEAIAPYTREEVVTRVEDDGSIAILRFRYRPVATGDDRFTFVRELAGREVHSEEEPSAAVTERAELLRREAALVTADARERYLTAADALETALLHDEDRLERLQTSRAAAKALSERINSHLQHPPLDE
jgi:hypothetical protein